MLIFIRTPYGKMHTIDVEPEMTIAEIKKRIEAKYQIPIAKMDILFKGSSLKDEITIDEAKIKQEDILNIVKPLEKEGEGITLLVKTDFGKIFSMTFNPSDIIEGVKKKICDKLGVSPKSMRIFHRGQRLEDCCAIIKTSIKEGDTIFLVNVYLFAGSG